MPKFAHFTRRENASFVLAHGFSDGLNADGFPPYRFGVWLVPAPAAPAAPNQVVVVVDLDLTDIDLECYRLYDRASSMTGFLLPATLVNARSKNTSLVQSAEKNSYGLVIEA